MISYEKCLMFYSYLENLFKEEQAEISFRKFSSIHLILKRLIEDYKNNLVDEALYEMNYCEAEKINKQEIWYHIFMFYLHLSYIMIPSAPSGKKDLYEAYRELKNIESWDITPAYIHNFTREYKYKSYEEIICDINKKKRRKK